MVNFPEGDYCEASQSNRTVTMEIYCDHSVEKLEVLPETEFRADKCENTIVARSKYACPLYKFTSWYDMLYVHKYIVASFMAVLGFFLLFLGRTFSKFSEFIIVTAGITMLFHMFMPIHGNQNLFLCKI